MADSTPVSQPTGTPSATPARNAAAVTVPAEAKSTAAPPPAFKIVKVRKPDGTIVRVRRPIDAAVAGASLPASSPPTAKSATVDTTVLGSNVAMPATSPTTAAEPPTMTPVVAKSAPAVKSNPVPAAPPNPQTKDNNTPALVPESILATPATPAKPSVKPAVEVGTTPAAKRTNTPISKPTTVPAATDVASQTSAASKPSSAAAQNGKKPSTAKTSTSGTEQARPSPATTAPTTVNNSANPPPPAYSESPPIASSLGVAAVDIAATEATEHVSIPTGFLTRIGFHAARAASAFVPQLEIGDWEMGDVEVESDIDSDDSGGSDDDDDDDWGGDDREKNLETESGGDGTNDDGIAVSGNGIETTRTGTGAAGVGSVAAKELATGVSRGALQAHGQAGRSVVGNGQTVEMQTKKNATAANKQVNGKTPIVNVNGNIPEAPQRAARTLRRRNPTDPSRIVIWAIMIILPLLFIILGILVAVSNGRPSSSALGNGVNQALKVGVSAWPIIFAAVAAQSLRALATWRVERGVKLMTLEQLISSNSVASSFKQPFILRRFDWVTLALFALWSLSPLAGQALVRVQFTGQSTTTSPVSIPYVNTEFRNLGYMDSSNSTPGAVLDTGASIQRLFTSAFLPRAPYALPSLDSWNHPLIPPYEELTGTPDPATHWVDIGNPGADVNGKNYSALYGIPLLYWGSENSSTYTMTISSAYIRFNCTPLEEKTLDAVNATVGYTGYDNPYSVKPLHGSPSTTLWVAVDAMGDRGDYVQITDGYKGGDRMGNFTFASLIDRDPPASLQPARRQLIGDNTPQDSNATYASARCNYKQTFVETMLSCTGNVCSATKMRLLPGVPQRNYTGAIQDLGYRFVVASGGPTSRGLLTDTEAYILDPTQVDRKLTTQHDLMTVPNNVFVERLSLLFNTFWQVGFAPEYYTRALNSNTTYVGADGELYTSAGNRLNVAQATRTDYYEVWATSWAWLAVLLASSTILLFAGVAAVIWDCQTIVPDVLGFASSVARRSKYVDLPKMDLTMSGAERARQLQKTKVMMQDVKPDAPVGRVALGTWHKEAKKLEAGRPYR